MNSTIIPKRAAILVRISDARITNGEREHEGVDRQLEDCRKLAAHLGWTAGPDEMHIVTENDVSAFKRRVVCRSCYLPSRECACPTLPGGRRTVLRTYRPGFRKLLAMLASGEADALIAYDLDRACRDPRDLEDLIDCVEARHPRIPVESVTGSLRLANDADVATARVMVAMGNKSSRDTARRVSRKREELAGRGAFGGGQRPFGYAADGVTVIESEAREIRRWASELLKGVSLRSVAEDARARGVPTVRGAAWQASTIRDIVASPRVAGLAMFKGEITGDAMWPPILPRAEWEALRLLLTNPARRNHVGNTPKHLGSLIYRCGPCADAGRDETVSVRGNRWGLSYNCRATGGGHLRRKCVWVDEFVVETVVARLAQPDARDLIAAPAATPPCREALAREMSTLNTRRKAVLALVADGTYSAGEAREHVEPLNARIGEIERELATRTISSPLSALPLGEGEAAVRERWDLLPLGVKREIVRTLVTVTLLRGRPRYAGGGYFSPDTVRIEWK